MPSACKNWFTVGRWADVSNKQHNADQRAADVPTFAADILPAIADGRIRPVVDRMFPFTELPAARAHMEANAHLGKIVVTITH